MFATATHFHPSLIFASKAAAYAGRTSLRGSSLDFKYLTLVKMSNTDNRNMTNAYVIKKFTAK
jgi:hypothetical protein